MKIILGITGSIAGYKSLELIRLLKSHNNEVKVILTEHAHHFVTPLSCQTLSENEVYTDQFMLNKGIKHLSLSEWGDLLVVAPATANIIAKAANGIADDLLSTTILSFTKPVLFVPAMDTGMWENKILQNNITILKKNGYHILEPVSGPLASGKIGKGRFPPFELIYKKILCVNENYPALANLKFLITGGRTEEDIDSVRVLTNRASGLIAKELYEAGVCRGAECRLIMGEANVPILEGTDLIKVRTSSEMLYMLKKNIAWCDFLIMTAAIGDYLPEAKTEGKIHKSSFKIKLVKNIDLLKALRPFKKDKIFVGFSVEDRDVLKRAKEKLKEKGLDLIVFNPVSAIGSFETEAGFLRKNGKFVNLKKMSKWELANQILNECLKIKQGR